MIGNLVDRRAAAAQGHPTPTQAKPGPQPSRRTTSWTSAAAHGHRRHLAHPLAALELPHLPLPRPQVVNEFWSSTRCCSLCRAFVLAIDSQAAKLPIELASCPTRTPRRPSFGYPFSIARCIFLIARALPASFKAIEIDSLVLRLLEDAFRGPTNSPAARPTTRGIVDVVGQLSRLCAISPSSWSSLVGAIDPRRCPARAAPHLPLPGDLQPSRHRSLCASRIIFSMPNACCLTPFRIVDFVFLLLLASDPNLDRTPTPALARTLARTLAPIHPNLPVLRLRLLFLLFSSLDGHHGVPDVVAADRAAVQHRDASRASGRQSTRQRDEHTTTCRTNAKLAGLDPANDLLLRLQYLARLGCGYPRRHLTIA